MNALIAWLARLYRPLYLRNTLVEGDWIHRMPAPVAPIGPKRFTLLAWVAAVMPGPDGRPG